MVFVSVVVPTYNRREDVLKCITALGNQTYPADRFEILIVDDGSTDGTQEAVQKKACEIPNLSYYRVQVNNGDGHARNQGVNAAKGVIIAFTDDDCIPSPAWIEEAVSVFEKEESLTGVDGKTLPEEKIDFRKKIFNYARTMNSPGPSRYPPTCNVFYRKKDLIEIGGFDEKIRYANDVDLAARLLEKGKKMVFAEKVLVLHKVDYLPFFKYLRRMSVFQSYPLVVKKNPSMRKNFFLGFFIKKTHIYPILITISLFFYLLSTRNPIFNLLVSIGLVLSLIAFLSTRVLVDKNVSAYPLRTMLFIRYFLLDFTDTFYLLRGSIKYRSLVL